MTHNKNYKCGYTKFTKKKKKKKKKKCMRHVFTKMDNGIYRREYEKLIHGIKKIFSNGNIKQKKFVGFFIKAIERWLGNQCLEDPYIYISHGPNHSLEVVQYIQVLYDNDIKVQKNLMTNYKLQYPLVSKADDLNVLFTRTVISLLALLHDVGYTDVAKNLGTSPNAVKKWIHAKSGEKIVRKNITLFFSNAIDIINKSGKYDIKKTKLTKDFLDAIKYHNADSEKKKFNIDDMNFTPCWKPHDKELGLTAGKNWISREYVLASIKKSPFIYLIRTADNMDFSRSRMIPEHKDIKLMQMLLKLYKINKSIKKHETKEQKKHQKLMISKWWMGLSTKTRNNPGMLTFYNELHVPSYRAIQFPYFYSVWIVKKSVLTRTNKDEPATYNLRVTYYDEKGIMNVKKNKWAALYQLIRFNDALKSIKAKGRQNSNITERINVSLFKENGIPIGNDFLLSNIEILYGNKNHFPKEYKMKRITTRKARRKVRRKSRRTV